MARPAGFESSTGGFRWRSMRLLRTSLLLGSNPDGITKKSRELMFMPDLSNFVVRPAGFEPAAYGFEVPFVAFT